MILGGELGEINAIRSFYIQGWLRTRLELQNQKQAAWRSDPKQSGAAGCFGDIGTHAYNLAAIHDRADAGIDQRPSESLRTRPRIGRLRHGGRPI